MAARVRRRSTYATALMVSLVLAAGGAAWSVPPSPAPHVVPAAKTTDAASMPPDETRAEGRHERAGSGNAKLRVTFKGPKSVPASVRVIGKRKTVLTKPARGRSTRVSLPSGKYRLIGATASEMGRTYEPRMRVTRVVLERGKTTSITVRMVRVRLATDLAVVALTSTSTGLQWKAPKGATVRLRRTAGDGQAASPHAGSPVTISAKNLRARNVTDDGLAPDTSYTYTLFSRVSRGRWEAAPGLTIHTSQSGNSAAYVVKPGAIVVRDGDDDKITVTPDQTVVLHPAAERPDALLGSAVILPISAQLPAGLVGKVTAIAPDGGLVLGEGDIPSAFDYLAIDYDLSEVPMVLTAKQTTTPGRSTRAGMSAGCDRSRGIDVGMEIKPGGHFRHHINYNKFHLPSSVTLDARITPTFSPYIKVATGVACGVAFTAESKFAIGPIPMLAKFDAYGNVTAEVAATLKRDIVAGAQVQGTLPSSGGVKQTFVFQPQPLSAEVTPQVGFEFGVTAVIGPGVSLGPVGAVTGITQDAKLWKRTFTPAGSGCGFANQKWRVDDTASHSTGTKTSVWFGGFSDTTYATTSGSVTFPNSPRTIGTCAPAPPPPSAKSLTVGPLTLSFASSWASVTYGAYGPGGDMLAVDTTQLVGGVHPSLQVTKMSWCSNPDLVACVVDSLGGAGVLGPAPAVTVGGRAPSGSARYLEKPGRDSLVWCFDAEDVCVQYRAGSGTEPLSPSQALRNLLVAGTWS